MKPLLALLTGVLISVGGPACGGTGRRAGSASQTTSTATATDGISTTAFAGPTRTRQHMFGDYDYDDYYNDKSHSDDDNDDNDKPTDKDSDSDSSNNRYYDSDDNSVRAFGHTASVADRQAITALVKNYYATAAIGDGEKACSLIYSTIAKAVPEDLGVAGPSYLRGGKTCAGIMSKLFEQSHLQLAAYAEKLEVTGVRLVGNRGFAVLGFKTIPGRQIAVEREHGVWKIHALLDNELP